MKILIVEDDAKSANMMRKFLEVYGNAEIVNDGKVADRLVKENKYDLIILDIFLPNLDGIKVLESIRVADKIQSDNKKTKVIIVSSTDEQKYISQANYLECNAYFVKPINLDVLDATIEKIFL